MRLIEKLEEAELAAQTRISLGIVYYYLNQTAAAYQEIHRALNTLSALSNAETVAEAYGQLGHLLEKDAAFDSALFYQRKAFQLLKSAGNERKLGAISEHLGSIFEDLENYDSAYTYFHLGYELMLKVGDEVGLVSVMNNLGDISRKQGEVEGGLIWTRKALSKARSLELKYQESSALRDMAKAYSALGQFDSAFHYQEASQAVYEEVYSLESNRKIAFFETIFNVEKQNNAIRELELQKGQEQTRRNWVFLSIGLLMTVAAVVFSRQRLKIRTKERILKQEKQMHEQALENERLSRGRLEIELRHKKLEEEHLNFELQSQQKALASRILQLSEKNKLLGELKKILSENVADLKPESKKRWKELAKQIDFNFNHDKHWEEFRSSFEQVHQQFFNELKKRNDKLTGNDLRICALMRINLHSEDIATLLGISQDSLRVARYRLRKKLGLDAGENLRSFIISIG